MNRRAADFIVSCWDQYTYRACLAVRRIPRVKGCVAAVTETFQKSRIQSPKVRPWTETSSRRPELPVRMRLSQLGTWQRTVHDGFLDEEGSCLVCQGSVPYAYQHWSGRHLRKGHTFSLPSWLSTCLPAQQGHRSPRGADPLVFGWAILAYNKIDIFLFRTREAREVERNSLVTLLEDLRVLRSCTDTRDTYLPPYRGLVHMG